MFLLLLFNVLYFSLSTFILNNWERERFVVKKKQHKHQQLQTFVSDNFDKPYKMSAEKLMNIAEEDKAKALVKIIL